MSAIDIPALRSLLAAATPGEWKSEIDSFGDGTYEATVTDPRVDLLAKIDTGIELWTGGGEHSEWTGADSQERDSRYHEAKRSQAAIDASLIAAAVNALPSLLAIASAAYSVRDDYDDSEVTRLPASTRYLIAAVDAARSKT